MAVTANAPPVPEFYIGDIIYSSWCDAMACWITHGSPHLIGYVCLDGHYGLQACRRQPAPFCTARNGSVIGGSRTSKSSIRERALYASTSSLVSSDFRGGQGR